MALDVGQVIGGAVSAYLSVVAGFAAVSATRAVEQGDQAGLASRVFRTITWTTLGLGVPAVIALLVALNTYGTDGGMISLGSMSVMLVVFGGLGLLAAWVGNVVMGFVGSAVAAKLPPLAAGLTVFVCCSFGAPAFFVLALVGRVLKPH